VCIVGLVAAVLALGSGPRDVLRSLWRPSASYERDSLRADKVLIISVAVATSSLAFGVLHVAPGSGWGIGKLPEATFGGAVLGYLYVKYGFHVAVLTHWGIDFLGSAFAFFGQGVYGVPWWSSPGFVLQRLVTDDLVGGIGLAAFLLVTYSGLRLVRLSADGDASKVPRSS
jgi:hypothetical protein